MEKKLKIAIPNIPEETPNYIHALNLLGAIPVNTDTPTADGFDGLLLPGGGDIAPHFFGQENEGSREIDEKLDILQFETMNKFLSAGKPIFGICRGVQVINVFYGGTLIQDVPNAAHHMHTPEGDNIHSTEAVEGSFIYGLYGKTFCVNSSHHQAAGIPGTSLKPAQYSDDGLIEALEHESYPVFGVQWHPERICLDRLRADAVDGAEVLKYFLEKCR